MRQTAYAKRQKFINLKGAKRFLESHKKAIIVIILVALVLAGWGLCTQIQNSNKFSKSDFDVLARTARTSISSVTGATVHEGESCTYARPTEFADKRLYCHIALAAYTHFESTVDARELAHRVEHSAAKLGAVTTSNLSSFIANPGNNIVIYAVKLMGTYPSAQCTFEVSTLRLAKALGNGMPYQSSDDLIAASFYCSAESQGEYFPVTP